MNHLYSTLLGFGVSFILLNLPLMSQSLTSLSNGLDAEEWYIINDGVMGGLSESQVVQLDNSIGFSGVVRLENNGGFASIRKRVEPISTVTEDSEIQLKVKGDGRQYECRLRMAGSRLSYVHTFPTTAGEITLVTLGIQDFIPSFRGKSFELDDVGSFDLRRLQEFGLLIAGKQKGAFKLNLLEAFVK